MSGKKIQAALLGLGTDPETAAGRDGSEAGSGSGG